MQAMPATALYLPHHPPPLHRHPFQRIKHQVLHQQPNQNQNHHRQAGEHLVGVQLIAILKDVLAQPALAAGCTKHRFSGDQRAPGKRPADFQPGEDRRQCGRNQDEQHEAHALEAIVAPGHAQGFRHTEKPGVGVQRQGPEHRMHQIRRVDPPC